MSDRTKDFLLASHVQTGKPVAQIVRETLTAAASRVNFVHPDSIPAPAPR